MIEEESLPGWLLARAGEHPGRVALREKRLGYWHEITWAGYATRAARFAAGLRALGVEPGDRVAIHADNRVEWLYADLAAQGLGAISIGVYPTSPPAEVRYLLEHSGAKVLVAEDQEQLDKALEVRASLPELRRIVVVDPRGCDLDDRVLSWEAVDELGAGDQAAADQYRDAVAALDPEAVAIIVYTSGTTGPPKGAMLTHANLVFAGRTATETFGGSARDDVLSYLPLCHVAERLISVVDALAAGYTVHFGESVDTFIEDLSEAQPTFFLGVPRVWEKLLAATEIRMADASRVKRAAYRFWLARCRRAGERRREAGRLNGASAITYLLGWLFAFRALRSKLGMRRVRTALSGAAPIAPEVLEWFWTIGVPIREAYGQTENSAICTAMPEKHVRIGTVGTPVEGVEIRVSDDGEILTRSKGVFAGYYRNEEATRAAVDEQGWLHTGDVGTLDDEGFLTITDRMKDIIITAGGKNISPQYIENLLKVSPYVREAIIVGDQRPHLSALIGVEPDTVGDWCTRRGLSFTSYADLSGRPEVRELIQGVVADVNEQLAQVEKVKRFELLGVELDQDAGQLTATMKVKRAAIADQFAETIDAMYQRGAA